MTSHSSFPLRGVIGVVANAANEIDMAAANGLQCVELRADLLLDSGHSLDQSLAMISHAKRLGLATLWTLRHPTHGGKFSGGEQQRAAISRQALAQGADLIDLEWDTDAAATMLGDGAAIILSYHNFRQMPDNAQLQQITHRMSQARPAAIKVVPTASSTADALAMLNWVSQGGEGIRRIGFAMGELGACSRILTTVCGAPVTYTSFGPAVAPGQIELDKLLNDYRVMQFNENTAVTAVIGDGPAREQRVAELNNQYRSDNVSAVAVGFAADSATLLEQQRQALRISTILLLDDAHGAGSA